MDWLNYHHLLYFWVAAREGSITKACRLLHLAQPTVSGQIKSLERSLKAKLFDRSGRTIVLTETGRVVFRYADEIFSLGRELREVVHGGGMGRSQRLTVGVADALPKLLVHRLLQPALGMGDEVQVHCIDGEPDRLVAQLALHELDVVISDVPASPQLSVRSFTHLLGECGVTFFGTKALARRYRRGFPESLTGAAVLLPTGNTALRRTLDKWFDDNNIQPRIRGEFSDSALLKAFGSVGEGLFVAPSVVERDVQRMYNAAIVGRDASIRERFYAITVDKRLKHPAVVAITQAARTHLFGGDAADGPAA